MADLKNPVAHGLHWGCGAEDPLPLRCMYSPGGHKSDGGIGTVIICLDHKSLDVLFVFTAH